MGYPKVGGYCKLGYIRIIGVGVKKVPKNSDILYGWSLTCSFSKINLSLSHIQISTSYLDDLGEQNMESNSQNLAIESLKDHKMAFFTLFTAHMVKKVSRH